MRREEQVRWEILTQCYALRPGARDAEHMARSARHEGELTDATPAEFARECAYLLDRKLIEKREDGLCAGHARYAITAAGIDMLEREGLV